ncbi:hypothetical protein MNBD_ALPHA12-1995 [hydrothermal vent metagenome]|uniref:HTH marR-type domain-containing protein n=1 Tax=hydrothermal vent metagenome TaxID=652676 RepID=A0A3B0U378_9ZZZZ
MLPMAYDLSQTTLYRLIEAGQLARNSLLRPLAELGLAAGDDAIILALPKSEAVSIKMLCAGVGLDADSLELRLERLVSLGMVRRIMIEGEVVSDVALSEQGSKVQKKLRAYWQELEEALMGELKPKQQRRLEAIMTRFTNLLAL